MSANKDYFSKARSGLQVKKKGYFTLFGTLKGFNRNYLQITLIFAYFQKISPIVNGEEVSTKLINSFNF